MFLVLLLLSVSKPDVMLRSSGAFSKVMFWVENLLFIAEQFIYEVLLVPVIYTRVACNIFVLTWFEAPGEEGCYKKTKCDKITEKIKSLFYITGWILFGFAYLMIFGVLSDVSTYIQILCDDRMTEGLTLEMELADIK